MMDDDFEPKPQRTIQDDGRLWPLALALMARPSMTLAKALELAAQNLASLPKTLEWTSEPLDHKEALRRSLNTGAYWRERSMLDTKTLTITVVAIAANA